MYGVYCVACCSTQSGAPVLCSKSFTDAWCEVQFTQYVTAASEVQCRLVRASAESALQSADTSICGGLQCLAGLCRALPIASYLCCSVNYRACPKCIHGGQRCYGDGLLTLTCTINNIDPRLLEYSLHGISPRKWKNAIQHGRMHDIVDCENPFHTHMPYFVLVNVHSQKLWRE